MLNIFQNRKIVASLIIGPFFILLFTWIFMELESWSFINALYFTVSTLTTVGYGDLVPTSDLSRLVATILMILLVPIILVLLGIISDLVVGHFHKITIKKD